MTPAQCAYTEFSINMCISLLTTFLFWVWLPFTFSFLFFVSVVFLFLFHNFYILIVLLLFFLLKCLIAFENCDFVFFLLKCNGLVEGLDRVDGFWFAKDCQTRTTSKNLAENCLNFFILTSGCLRFHKFQTIQLK